MSKLTLDADDGLTTIEVRVPDRPEPVSARLDVARSLNRYIALARQHGEDSDALGEAWVAYLAEQGLPGLPHRTGYAVAEHLDELLQKKATTRSDPAGPAESVLRVPGVRPAPR